jgi:subtilisin family serine protease/type II secretory pathway pseudopilin PulG
VSLLSKPLAFRATPRPAHTLVEILIATAVVGVLVGITVPAIFHFREKANAVSCKSNLRQVGVALAHHVGVHGHYPISDSRGVNLDRNPTNTWLVKLLPYLDGDGNEQTVQGDMVVKTLLCPSDGLGGTTSTLDSGVFSHSNYLAFYGPYSFGIETPRSAFGWGWGARPEDIRDGQSNTMVVGEYLTGLPESSAPNDFRGVLWLDQPGSSQLYAAIPPNSGAADVLRQGQCYSNPDRDLPCTETTDDIYETAGARSRHRGGVHVLLGDGSVRFVNENIAHGAWLALATIDGGEVFSDATAPGTSAGGLHKQGTLFRHRFLVGLDPSADVEGINQQLKAIGGEILETTKSKDCIVAFARMSKDMVARVESLPGVIAVEQESGTFPAQQTIPTGIRRINGTFANPPIGTGFGFAFDIDVAVLDTGGDPTHPDLTYADLRSFGPYLPQDFNGHGTHIAGIIAARDNSFGVVGVAPGARIHSYKILPDDTPGTRYAMIAALNYIRNNPGPIKVVNISVRAARIPSDAGGASGDSSFGGQQINQAITNVVLDAGIPVVVAAGSHSLDPSDPEGRHIRGFSPASARRAIVVMALADYDGLPGGLATPPGAVYGDDDTMANFSNFGQDEPDQTVVMAPGVNILSTVPFAVNPAGYEERSGTSMAAAHMTGLLARQRMGPLPPPRQVRLPPFDSPDRIRNASGTMQNPNVITVQDPREYRSPGAALGAILNNVTEFIPTLPQNLTPPRPPGFGDNASPYRLINAAGL